MIAFLAARFLALPPWAIKIVEMAVLLAALAGALVWAHHHVYQEGRDDEAAERKADDDAALRVATLQAAADQKKLSDQFLLAQRDRFQENHDAQATINDLRSRVRSGAVGLRLPAGSAVCSAATGTGAAAGPGPVAKDGSVELVPGTADAFVSIAGRIAAGVRRENNLIDAYNRCAAAANKP